MIQILGYIFLSIILALGIVIADYFLPGTYLTSFLNDHFIETFAGLVGFNIASVIFLLGQLINLEERIKNKKVFENTRREIKHNSYFLLIAFLLSIVILIIRPDLNSVNSTFSNNILYFSLNTLVLVLFILGIVSIIQILSAAFVLGKQQD